MVIYMKNLKEAFGLRLKEIRKSKNYTQEVLAELLDLSPRQLIRIENGENFPSSETIGKISLILEVELSSLFDFSWNEDTMYFKNGNYNKPSLKVIKTGDLFTIKPISPAKNQKYFNNNLFKDNEYETQIFNYCKENNNSAIVEFFENKKRTSIKKFYPDKTIEDIVSKEDIEINDLYNNIIFKLKKISNETEKLNFIKLAIDSLENKDSIEKLNFLVKGMLLATHK